ncbi:MAG: tRNA (adenosine(37)-N6)-threonylcarbamoyltransferase complex ATPase subunit type 1 TsaE [Pseudomonadota bacterium]|nr:tRNA (adenosine(37)-N6)-threonylcarbamoyltransferase complex ATPase subunit type 1 TsaE [Pseudomonadota bacterium]
MRIVIASKSSEETLRIGRIIGETASPGEVIALVGELGTGKTCLTQGIARGLAVPEAYPITSPTFTLINEYPGRLPLYHFDIYRLEGASDLEDMGYEDYFYGEGVTVIEWAERVLPLLPAGTLFVDLVYQGEHERELTLVGNEELIGKINNLWKEGGC